MPEFSMPLDELMQEPSLNGHMDSVEAEAKPGSRLDAGRGVFITSNGDEIEMSGKRITQLMMERIMQQGKPKIPMIEVTLLGKHKQLEANPNDEGYKALLAEWQYDAQIRTLRYMYNLGVKGQPPQDFIDEQRLMLPDAEMTELDLKYLWVCSLVPDEDVEAFSEAISGYRAPTEKGIEESSQSFRRPS